WRLLVHPLTGKRETLEFPLEVSDGLPRPPMGIVDSLPDTEQSNPLRRPGDAGPRLHREGDALVFEQPVDPRAGVHAALIGAALLGYALFTGWLDSPVLALLGIALLALAVVA